MENNQHGLFYKIVRFDDPDFTCDLLFDTIHEALEYIWYTLNDDDINYDIITIII